MGLARFRDGEVVEQFQSLVKPSHSNSSRHHPFDRISIRTTSTTRPALTTSCPKCAASSPIHCHRAQCGIRSLSFLRKHDAAGAQSDAIDTLELASIVMPSAPRYRLGSLATQIGDIELSGRIARLTTRSLPDSCIGICGSGSAALPTRRSCRRSSAPATALDWGLRAVFQAALAAKPAQFRTAAPGPTPFQKESIDHTACQHG